MITQAELKEILEYEPDTGEWTWLISPRANVPIGCPAGSFSDRGYRRIKIQTCVYVASRLAFLYMTGKWPADEVDHMNHDSSDDRWVNLREATQEQNSQNRRIRQDNKSGIVGVFWTESKQKWCAKINGMHIGYFASIEEATKARDELAKKLHGEFANLNAERNIS